MAVDIEGRVTGASIVQRPRAAFALLPVLGLDDHRTIAYDVEPRTDEGDFRGAFDAGIEAARLDLGVPVIIPVPEELLDDASFSPDEIASEAGIEPAAVIWKFVIGDDKADNHTVVRERAIALRDRSWRVAIDGVRVRQFPWQDVVAIRPTVICFHTVVVARLAEPEFDAAMAGVLALAGRLGCRVVARGVDAPETAEALIWLGVFYGTGSQLEQPVILDAALTKDGDQIQSTQWLRSRPVRRLFDLEAPDVGESKGRGSPRGQDTQEPTAVEERGVLFVPKVVPSEQGVVSADQYAALVADAAERMFLADSPNGVFHVLAEMLGRALSFDRLAIFEADWNAFTLQSRVLVGEDLYAMAGAPHPLGTGVTGWALRRGMPYNCGNTLAHPESAPIPGSVEDMGESLIVVPLTSRGSCIGVLDVWRYGIDQFSDAELERCTLLAKIGSDAWRRARETFELEQRVVTDAGTGLLNKRWWEELAPREAAQATRSGSSIALLLVDLDDFKDVNDTFGHAIGDAVLSHVAKALATSVRSGDAAIRLGGDEFLVMMRDCAEGQGLRAAEALRGAISRVTSSAPRGLTASVGVAVFPDHGATLDEVLGAADEAMYEAKARGKDQSLAFSKVEVPEATSTSSAAIA
jgi:diguanylate cyclase (GGDEF)-like protein